MSEAVDVATRIQIGVETVRGTPVTPTRQLIGNMRFNRIQEFEDFSNLDFGVLARTARAPVITREGFEGTFEAPLSTEEILFALESGVKGSVTPVAQAGGADGQLWTFRPPQAADPAPNSYTLKFTESNLVDTPTLQAPFVLCTGWEINANDEGLAEVKMDLVGRKVTEVSATSLSLPVPTYAPNLRWRITADDSWATMIGGSPTLVTGQVYGFSYKFGSFIVPRYYLDNRTDLDFSVYAYKRRVAEISFDLIHDPAATGQVQIEETKKNTSAKRFIGLKLTGPAIGGAFHKVELRGCFYHAPDSLQERGNDRDGNLTTTWHLLSAYDSVEGTDVEYLAQNNITSFPA